MMIPQQPAAQAQTLLPDTVVTVVARDALSTAVDLSTVLLALALLLVAVAVVALVFALRSGTRQLKLWASRQKHIVDRLQGTLDNVEAITASLRGDVERVSSAVDGLAERLDQASDRMEERIEDFNALMEVVQEEAEDVFVRTASKVRGVQATAEALRGRSPDTRPARALPEQGVQISRAAPPPPAGPSTRTDGSPAPVSGGPPMTRGPDRP